MLHSIGEPILFGQSPFVIGMAIILIGISCLWLWSIFKRQETIVFHVCEGTPHTYEVRRYTYFRNGKRQLLDDGAPLEVVIANIKTETDEILESKEHSPAFEIRFDPPMPRCITRRHRLGGRAILYMPLCEADIQQLHAAFKPPSLAVAA